MLNQSLDTAIGGRLVRNRGLVVESNVYRTGGNVLHGGRYDLERLDHLLHPNPVARKTISTRGTDHLECALKFGIGEIRLILAEIADDARGAGHRAAATR